MGAREQMVDAGERLVAERGIGAMSLREVQVAAGQRNKSAAQYHFGSREGLLEAIVTTRMAPVNEVRRRRLDELDAAGAPVTVRDLVAVVVEPLAEAVLRRGSCWARFLAQASADPELDAVVRRSFEAGPYREALRRLADLLVEVPEALRGRRVDHAVGLLVVSLAASEAVVATGGRPQVPVAAQVADLVDICTAVLEAPASTATTEALSVQRRPA